jgi:hypothetical protein
VTWVLCFLEDKLGRGACTGIGAREPGRSERLDLAAFAGVEQDLEAADRLVPNAGREVLRPELFSAGHAACARPG